MYEEKVINDKKTSINKCSEKMDCFNEDESHKITLINNEVIIITQNETFFEGKWKERNTNKKIDGTIKNNSGKITFSTEKKKPNTVNEYHYVNDFNAIFYLSEDIKQIKIMTEDSKNEFLTLELLTTVENGQTIEE